MIQSLFLLSLLPAFGAPAVPSVGSYLQTLLPRNVFGLPVPTDGCTYQSETISIPYQLVGTLKAHPPELSSALVADREGGLPKAYSIGDTLVGREVVSIETDRVGLLGRGGTLEYLTMTLP